MNKILKSCNTFIDTIVIFHLQKLKQRNKNVKSNICQFIHQKKYIIFPF